MLMLQDIRYLHPDKELLFNSLSFTINTKDKVALVGNNGSGKSTLLRIMAGILQPAAGTVKADSKPWYIPQHFGQYNHHTLAQALGVAEKLKALHGILAGAVSEANLATLDDDWTIEERCAEALAEWGLQGHDLQRRMDTISGGQKTKLFLAAIAIHKPDIVLMDEPSNHLDAESRNMLYRYIQGATSTLVVVSHDRSLLNLLDTTYELANNGITAYGGNYEFYVAQKAIEENALEEDLKSQEKALRKARETEREAIERQQKLDARGKKKQEKAGLPTISMNTLRNNAEKSTARTKDVHAAKTDALHQQVNELRKELPAKDKMKLGFDTSALHTGKLLIDAKDIQYSYQDSPLWPQPVNMQVYSGQRIAIKGANGSGKTTLIKMILGSLQPVSGTLYRADFRAVYIDQDYSLVNNSCTVYEQAQQYNNGALQEHEVKSRLTHFLFTRQDWDKPCHVLSGGERMRLILCCLTMGSQPPDMIVLDEPTNNLDIRNIEILTAALCEYLGTIVVVSHDSYFLEEIDAKAELCLGNIL